MKYDVDSVTCFTWGVPKRMTWKFWLRYCDEGHVLLTKNCLGQYGGAVDMQALPSVLQEVAA